MANPRWRLSQILYPSRKPWTCCQIQEHGNNSNLWPLELIGVNEQVRVLYSGEPVFFLPSFDALYSNWDSDWGSSQTGLAQLRSFYYSRVSVRKKKESFWPLISNSFPNLHSTLILQQREKALCLLLRCATPPLDGASGAARALLRWMCCDEDQTAG